jgi:hypothetical protein
VLVAVLAQVNLLLELLQAVQELEVLPPPTLELLLQLILAAVVEASLELVVLE